MIAWPKPRSRQRTAPVDFTLRDDAGEVVTYDAAFRAGRKTVLVWYRGHW